MSSCCFNIDELHCHILADISLRSQGPTACLLTRTLRELHEEGMKEQGGIWNALDLKLGPESLIEPPMYR